MIVSSKSARLARFLTGLFKSLWLFFPGILFILLAITCFWKLGQGKDIIVSFMENKSEGSFNYTRPIFFVAIAFWVYATWYTSRIIAYIKLSSQKKDVQTILGANPRASEETYMKNEAIFGTTSGFLDEFPRLIGNACFLALELAVLQSPVLYSPISPLTAWIILFLGLIVLSYINSRLAAGWVLKPSFRKTFYILLYGMAVLVLLSAFPRKVPFLALFGLLAGTHIVFIFYINLRRIQIEKKPTLKIILSSPTWFEKTMTWFCIPLKEAGYFRWLLFIGLGGMLFYLLSIFFLGFARHIGPFPFMILGFAVLLGFGNIVTAFSVRSKVNFHFILLLLAFFLGLKETHYVRILHLDQGANNYSERPDLAAYLSAWLEDRKVLDCTDPNGYDVYFVMANGGASRSGYWTSSVLGKIEDSSLTHGKSRFSDHVFCLSGTSGGGVGVATFFALLRDKAQQTRPLYNMSARSFLGQDYFTFTAARMLGPDFFNYIFHFSTVEDRGAALESSFEETCQQNNDSVYSIPFYDGMSKFPALKNGHVSLPILCVNTTRMQDGNPGVVTNLRLDSGLFNHRVDVLELLNKDSDISMASGAILGARFPYLSPAGRIGKEYFVDGGYFDNSGAGVVQEMIRGILNLGLKDSCLHGDSSRLYRQVRKLHFKILHITNSPNSGIADDFLPVAPIKNDILSPILAITGSYDMQTTVNDSRLINYVHDVNQFNNRADYMRISLYEEYDEWMQDPLRQRFPKGEPPYSMNWFMSDTTMRRIDNRLTRHSQLNTLIATMNQP